MKDYIGDGVYVSDELNEGHLTLTTGNHDPALADNIIHLEPLVVNSLLNFLEQRKLALRNKRFQSIIDLIPEDLRYKISPLGEDQLDIDNLEHDETLAVMRVLKVGRWKRKESGVEGKLDYVGMFGDIRVRLWAAGPPDSCRVVEEEYEIPATKGIRKRVICRETVHPDEISSEQAL